MLGCSTNRSQYKLKKFQNKKLNRDERCAVKFFVSDMRKPYAELSEIYLKEATRLVDKHHYVRRVIWAFERVRKKPKEVWKGKQITV